MIDVNVLQNMNIDIENMSEDFKLGYQKALLDYCCEVERHINFHDYPFEFSDNDDIFDKLRID